MRGIVLGTLLVLVAACAPQPHRPSPESTGRMAAPANVPAEARPPEPSAVPAATGPQVLARIRGWYDRTDRDCGSASRPAFLCSGVLVRATVTDPAFLPWDPSPASIASGGVSFSWLRADDNFAKFVFGYQNGLVFYPVLDTPAGLDGGIAVLCTFPHDGGTDRRPTLQGCGPTPGYAASGPCDGQGIATSAQWLAHYNQQADKYNGQCGWNVREGSGATADRFYQSVLARQGMDASLWQTQNELRLATWSTGSGRTLPIAAFFYEAGVAAAREKARTDQKRFHDAYGTAPPIVSVALPISKTGRATFNYADSDQGVSPGPEPEPSVRIDFETFAVGQYAFIEDTWGGIALFSPGGIGVSSPGANVSGRYAYMDYPGGDPDNNLMFFTPKPALAMAGRSVSFDYSSRVNAIVKVLFDYASPSYTIQPNTDGRMTIPLRGTAFRLFWESDGKGQLRIDNIEIVP